MFFNLKIGISGFCLLMLLTACGQKDMATYAQYLKQPDSGLMQKQSRSGLGFAASYQPLDFVVGKSLSNQERTAEGLTKARPDYVGLQYFDFDIYTEGGYKGQNALKDAMEKQVKPEGMTATMTYYAFGMQPDLGLIVGTDTLPCALYHLEQTGSWGQKMHFLVAFKDDSKVQTPQFKEDMRLYYHDKIFSNDTLFFTFTKADLNRIPDLKF